MALRFLLLLMTLLLGCSGGGAGSSASTPAVPDIKIANESNPGERLDVAALAVPGKTTLIEFTSGHCPACLEMASVMDFLSRYQEGLAIRQVEIDRPQASGIDFESPLAQQWELDAVPAFLVYDEKGQLSHRGSEAKDLVREWYGQAQMARNAQDSDVSGPYEGAAGPMGDH